MDIWGLCPLCAEWFPCARWFDRTAPEPRCATCDRAPVAIENRAALTVILDQHPVA